MARRNYANQEMGFGIPDPSSMPKRAIASTVQQHISSRQQPQPSRQFPGARDISPAPREQQQLSFPSRQIERREAFSVPQEQQQQRQPSPLGHNERQMIDKLDEFLLPPPSRHFERRREARPDEFRVQPDPQYARAPTAVLQPRCETNLLAPRRTVEQATQPAALPKRDDAREKQWIELLNHATGIAEKHVKTIDQLKKEGRAAYEAREALSLKLEVLEGKYRVLTQKHAAVVAELAGSKQSMELQERVIAKMSAERDQLKEELYGVKPQTPAGVPRVKPRDVSPVRQALGAGLGRLAAAADGFLDYFVSPPAPEPEKGAPSSYPVDPTDPMNVIKARLDQAEAGTPVPTSIAAPPPPASIAVARELSPPQVFFDPSDDEQISLAGSVAVESEFVAFLNHHGLKDALCAEIQRVYKVLFATDLSSDSLADALDMIRFPAPSLDSAKVGQLSGIDDKSTIGLPILVNCVPPRTSGSKLISIAKDTQCDRHKHTALFFHLFLLNFLNLDYEIVERIHAANSPPMAGPP